MLNRLRAEALALIAATPQCTLSTRGPAGVQASVVACIVCHDCMYVLVPSAADHLFNLEQETEVVVSTALWQVRGAALMIGGADGLHGTAPRAISARARIEGHTLVEVFPIRMQIEPAGDRWYRETINFDLRASHPSPAHVTPS